SPNRADRAMQRGMLSRCHTSSPICANRRNPRTKLRTRPGEGLWRVVRRFVQIGTGGRMPPPLSDPRESADPMAFPVRGGAAPAEAGRPGNSNGRSGIELPVDVVALEGSLVIEDLGFPHGGAGAADEDPAAEALAVGPVGAAAVAHAARAADGDVAGDE